MVEVKQIVVPVFSDDGSVVDTKKMIIKWLCPTCGQKMGSPSKISLVKNDSLYTVDLWKNECGHIPKVEELMQLGKKFNKIDTQKVGGRK